MRDMSKKKYDKIKNFSIEVPVVRTVAEIEKMLAMHGAKKIMKEYGVDMEITTLVFSIETKYGEMPVKLPIKSDKVFEVFKKQVSDGLLPDKYSERMSQ